MNIYICFQFDYEAQTEKKLLPVGSTAKISLPNGNFSLASASIKIGLLFHLPAHDLINEFDAVCGNAAPGMRMMSDDRLRRKRTNRNFVFLQQEYVGENAVSIQSTREHLFKSEIVVSFVSTG